MRRLLRLRLLAPFMGTPRQRMDSCYAEGLLLFDVFRVRIFVLHLGKASFYSRLALSLSLTDTVSFFPLPVFLAVQRSACPSVSRVLTFPFCLFHLGKVLLSVCPSIPLSSLTLFSDIHTSHVAVCT